MEGAVGAQYAIQIALHTLRERCKTLQERVALLEAENLRLSLRNPNETDNNSSNECDKLKQQTSELIQLNSQLESRCRMVSDENQQLWQKLTRLTKVNNNLGTQLSKINESLSQHQSQCNHLIRSKTFTQTDRSNTQRHLEENEKVSLELEDISLKLSDSISKQKMEFDEIIAELANDNVLLSGDGYAFNCLPEEPLATDEELEQDFEMWEKGVKEVYEDICQQRQLLKQQVVALEQFTDMKKRLKTEEKSTETDDALFVQPTSNNLNSAPSDEEQSMEVEKDKICPLCGKFYSKLESFEMFQQHVEEHFIP